MLTATTSTYLLKIYEMREREKKITPKTLAEEMGVSRPTAFEFIKKLENEGYVEKSGREYILTSSGMEESLRILRHHRVIETLLYEAGVNLDKACKIATLMQCILDDGSVESICKFLGYPKQCPHGRPIPEVVNNEY